MIFLWLMLMLIAGVALTSLICAALLVAGDEDGARCPNLPVAPRGLCATTVNLRPARGAP